MTAKCLTCSLGFRYSGAQQEWMASLWFLAPTFKDLGFTLISRRKVWSSQKVDIKRKQVEIKHYKTHNQALWVCWKFLCY